MERDLFKQQIFTITSPQSFEEKALELFRYQATNCTIYKNYIELIKVDPASIQSLEKIPFLPIEFFKSHTVKSGEWNEVITFTSSGTTNQTNPSRHFVRDLSIYEMSFIKAFDLFYGKASDMVILALLPSYLERTGSSLIFMADHLIKSSSDPRSGFFLNEFEKLAHILKEAKEEGKPCLLLGVTFGLLDFAEQFSLDLTGITIMETGGMKGRREEWTRQQVHAFLQEKWKVEKIHSEYGMTELLSQAYSKGDGIFECPPWMKVLHRETTDPFAISSAAGSGGLNVIDLANIDSCAFIATQDLVRLHPNQSFEVLGRFDHAEVRGCNLLVTRY
jgi:phenylacetate-coenzyme A ligase PaaK-like adenylate-forming protein